MLSFPCRPSFEKSSSIPLLRRFSPSREPFRRLSNTISTFRSLRGTSNRLLLANYFARTLIPCSHSKLLVDGFRTDSKSRAVSPREEDTLFPFILHSFGFHRCHGIPNCRTVSREKKDKVRRRKRSRYFPLQRDAATSKKCFPSTDRHDFPRHHRAIIRLFVMLRITRRKGKRRIERARGAVFRRTTRTAGTLVNTLLGNAVLVYVGTHLVFLSRARTSSPMCADAPKTAYYLLSLSLSRSLLPSLTTPESRSFQTDVAL